MPPRKTAGRPCLWNDYKRRSVHEAALRLLERKGSGALTMEALAREVGVAKGTLYLHFPDKEALLEEVVAAAFEPVIGTLLAALAAPGDPAERLRGYALRYERFLAGNDRLYRALLLEPRAPQRRFERFRHPRYKRLERAVAAVLEEGVRAGRFRPLDCDRAAVLFIEMNFSLCGLRVERGEHPAPGADAGLVADLFLSGLAPFAAPARRRPTASRTRHAS